MDKSRIKALQDFVAEAEELLDGLAEDLEGAQEQFETSGKVKADRINKIFREMHSLKGLASMFGLERITSLSHDLEGLLDRVRLGKSPLSPPLFQLLRDSRSVLHTLVAEAREGEEKTDVGPLLARIASGGEAPAATAPPTFGGLRLDEATLKSLTEYEEHRLKENLAEGNRLYAVQVGFDFASFDTRLRALNERLADLGEVISTLPVVDPSVTDGIHFRLIFGTELPMEAVSSQVAGDGGVVTDLLPAADQGEAEDAMPAEASSAMGAETAAESVEADTDDLRGLSNTIKVDIEKLDAVMGIIGEMTLIRSSLERIAGRLQAATGQQELAADLNKQTRNLTKKLGEIQRAIIDIRLVPIGQIFNRLNRTARRLARTAGKQVDVRLYGSETELDKMMMDQLVTPLIHLIRNAIDHGIESPEARLAAGKHEEGNLSISAFQKGNSFVIEVADDGRGLQVDRIREVAKARGLVAADAVPSQEECLELIFRPGFSSAETVTEVSGRGVGLDAVKSAIEAMKGSVSLWSPQGEGTTFQITLPITLAIIQSLIVGCCDEAFAIPISSVVETFRTDEGDIQVVEGREVFTLRGTTLPLLRLQDRFHLTRRAPREETGVFVVVACMQNNQME